MAQFAPVSGHCRQSRAVSLLALAAVSLPHLFGSFHAQAQSLSTDGLWVSEFLMRNPNTADPPVIAVHMAVLRGRGDSTHVLYYTHGYRARLILNALAGSNAVHLTVPSGLPSDPNYLEPFCGGASTLADGRAFLAGGTLNLGAPPTGNNFSMTFDARNYGPSAYGWVSQDPMPSGRY